MIEKICKECGQPFLAKNSRQIYCSREHFRSCPVCGKTYKVNNAYLREPVRACSVECTMKRKEESCLAKYGCKDPGNSKEAIERRKKTCLAKYGVDNPSKLPEISEKIKQSFMDRYGVMNAGQMESTKEKVRSTWEQKSDEELEEISEKRRHTCLERYGADNPLKISENVEKVKQTNLRKYGHECAMWSPEIREKINETLVSRYGTAEFWTNQDIIKKRIETCREKYGCDYAIAYPGTRKKIQDIIKDKYGGISPMHSKEVAEKVKQTTLERYGVYPVFLREDVMELVAEDRRGKRISKTQQQFNDMLNDIGLDTIQEFVLNRKIYDIRVLGSNILVEVDPSYTHSQQDNVYHQILDKFYHRDKSKNALDNGYRCIHVFDWDDRIKLAQMIAKPSNNVFARDCNVSMLSLKLTNQFLDDNHIQGGLSSQTVCIGLFLADQLVSVMTFGPSRYNKNYEWELLRFANRSDCRVVGGASKLFKLFIKEFHPKSIISYCDLAKFTGDVYEKIGMSFVRNTSPAKVWSKDGKKITDNLLRQRGYDQLFGTNFGKGTSNEELMIENGWRSVYDCGQSVWEWIAK